MEISLDKLPLGDVPRRNDPLGEFHCIRPDPRYAGWHEPTLHWTWRSSNWRVGGDADGRFLEQLHDSRYNNTLVIADTPWRRVRRVEVEVLCPSVTQEVGLVFAYQTALDYVCLHLDRDGALKLSRREHEQFVVLAEERCFAGAQHDGREGDRDGALKLSRREHEQFHVLAEERCFADAQHDRGDGEWSRLGVTWRKGKLVGLLDGEEVLSIPWRAGIEGKIGLLANCPARFRRLAADAKAVRPRKKLRVARYPRMHVVRKIATPGFGTTRQIRFGDLTGDGRPDIVLAQRVPLEGAAGYSTVGCLTALTRDGEVLWQSGTPTPQTPMAGDLPFQVNDIDGDGRNEVVCVRGFEIQVLDGATGQLKFAAPVPERPVHHPLLKRAISYFGSPDGHEFPRVVADSIRFADLAGRGAARDLLLKDRYHHLWALSPDLQPLWSWVGNLGHFPFAADLDGDGRDEVIVGYHWLSPDGEDRQSLHLGDHADAIFAGDIQGWGEPKVVRAGGDDGLLIAGLHGDLLAVHHGHVQRLSVASFRPDAPGLEYAICTYWGAPGIVALLDSTGKLLWSREYPVCGNTLQPVNWTGDGEELIYFSAHADCGGLWNWRGEQVAPFPSDGHPELCSEVLDLSGAGRDNLILWDPERLWTYAPAGDAEPRYRPRRPPLHSWSNYMCYWSLPGLGSTGV